MGEFYYGVVKYGNGKYKISEIYLDTEGNYKEADAMLDCSQPSMESTIRMLDKVRKDVLADGSIYLKRSGILIKEPCPKIYTILT